MTEFKQYKPGTFCWTDLATSEAGAAKQFYTELFGWQAIDMPVGPDSVYTMFQLRGKNVAALYQMNAEQQAQGVPPNWTSYVSVADAEAVAGKAKELGGALIVEPFDVMEEGRMALLQDPTGAMLALWQPINHIGAEICNEPGTLSWNELATRDTDKAAEFYTELFGWGKRTDDMGGFAYTSFSVGDRMNAGMIQMTEQWGDMPPHWMVYFAVADCDASAKKAEALGGTIGVQPTDIPPVGRFAVVIDPQGAAFTIIKLNNPE